MRSRSTRSLLSSLLVSLSAIAIGCGGEFQPSPTTGGEAGRGGEGGVAGAGGAGGGTAGAGGGTGGAGGGTGGAGGGTGGAGGGTGGAGGGTGGAGGGTGGAGGSMAACGNGVMDSGEACDDGNKDGGDCCSASCQVEAGCEIETNDTQQTANSFDSIAIDKKLRAIVSPPTDQDWFQFAVPPGKKAMTVIETHDGFASTCAGFAIDSEISLVDAQGVLMANDDDGGVEFCSKIEAGPLEAGDYFVKVTPSHASMAGPFDYGFTVDFSLYTCGDGHVDTIVHEGCDDGNATDGDGCNGQCNVEMGYSCSESPSKCVDGCGNGTLGVNEACDDGANAPNDGCSEACTIEVGYQCPNNACTSSCGDGVRAVGAENCDDGNTADGDGCSSSCTAEPGWEVEPNNVMANDFDQLALGGVIKGWVNPAGDNDRISVTIPANTTGAIIAETLDGVSTTCASLALDSYVRILDPMGFVIVNDDDGGTEGYCSRAVASGLAQGNYTVVVLASPAQPNLTFDYSLAIDVQLAMCGDGALQGGEECDDGGTLNGDGCNSQCKEEVPDEVEQNDDMNSANGPFVPPLSMTDVSMVRGAISPASDADYYAIDVQSVADMSVQTFDLRGPSFCEGIDTVVTVFASNGSVVASDDDAGIAACSRLEPVSVSAMRQLQPDTYFVRVESRYQASVIDGYKLAIHFSAVCGNGSVEGFEACDGGAMCDATCNVPADCGNLNLDAGETCDDGNMMSGDGCSANCQLEGPDVEPNNTIAQADARALDAMPVLITGDQVLAGSIGNLADRDMYKMGLAIDSVVRFETFDASGVDCLGETMTLRLFDAVGMQVDQDSDSGIQSCGAFVRVVPAGTYYVQVEETGVNGTIGEYRLEVNVQASSGSEINPNDDPGNANPLAGSDVFVWGGHQLAGDVDYYSLTVPAGVSIRAEVIEGGAKTCDSYGVDSYLSIEDENGSTIAWDDDAGRGYCSLIDGTGTSPANPSVSSMNLAGGKYNFRVEASPAASGMDAEFDYQLVITVR